MAPIAMHPTRGEYLSPSGNDDREVRFQDLLPTISTRALLEGFARVDPLVLALDRRLRIVWLSEEVRLLCEGAATLAGRPLMDLLRLLGIDPDDADPDGIERILRRLPAGGNAIRLGVGVGVGRSSPPLRCELNAFVVGGGVVGGGVVGSGVASGGELGEALVVCVLRRLPGDTGTAGSPASGSSGAAIRRPLSPSQPSFVFEATPDGVLTIDSPGLVAAGNEAAGRIPGHRPAALMDPPIASSQDSEAAAVPTQSAGHDETVISIRDVGERHEIQHEIQEELERKNEELESFVRSVAHDLRSPLCALLGFVRLLREERGAMLDATGLHFVDRIEEGGRNMDRLLDDLLELSRIRTTPACPGLVDPRPVLLQIQAELRLRLEQSRIDLVLPDAPAPLLCDRTRLYQLFANLIGNAIEHRAGDRPGRVEVTVQELRDGWEISVADDGPGIAPEDRERIFEMFETGSSQGSMKRSSGLGLAIVKQIVESHRGRVRVEGERGAGARFVVFLPRPAATPTPVTPLLAELGPPPSAPLRRREVRR